MKTEVINSRDISLYSSALARVARVLREGALVVFPTETVYGVAANAAHPDAVSRLRQVKGRSTTQPFTVHLGRKSDAPRYLTSAAAVVRRLARKAWPGPLTIVCDVPVPKETEIASLFPDADLNEIYHDGTVGLRCPDHGAARRLLNEVGVPVVASSANRTGNPPPFDLPAALRDMNGAVEYAIDAGQTRHKASSTVVRVRGNEWSVRRSGVIDERAIERMAQTVVLFVCTGNSCRSPMAEYMFRQKLADRLNGTAEDLKAAGYVFTSAGTMSSSGAPVSPGTRDELSQRGIDAREHRSQPLTVELIRQAERIWVMTPEHRATVLDLVPSVGDRVELLDPTGRSVPDPIGGGPEEYRLCAEQIERGVEAQLEEFIDADRNW